VKKKGMNRLEFLFFREKSGLDFRLSAPGRQGWTGEKKKKKRRGATTTNKDGFRVRNEGKAGRNVYGKPEVFNTGGKGRRRGLRRKRRRKVPSTGKKSVSWKDSKRKRGGLLFKKEKNKKKNAVRVFIRRAKLLMAITQEPPIWGGNGRGR